MYKEAYREKFIYFLDYIVPLVSPFFILATGDLTDGKDAYGITSRQNIEEWTYYYNALNARGYARQNFWYDLPGNHDRFDVLGNKNLKGLPLHPDTPPLNSTFVQTEIDYWMQNKDYYRIYGIQRDLDYKRVIHSDKVGNITIISVDGW